MAPPVSMLLLIGGASFLVMGVVGGFFIIPKIVASEIGKEKALTPGTISRGLYEKMPHPLYLKIYLWNVTNPMGVQKGEKPKLQEVGPFVYDEYKWKVKVKDRNMDDSVLFRPISWFYYNQTLSGSLTGEEIVTVPNMLFLSIIMKVHLEMYPVVGMLDAAVMELFRKPTSIYVNVKVRDILFDGISINCTVKEFMTKTICGQIKAENRKEVQEVSPNIFKFSFFGARNGTEGEWIRANRGSKEPSKAGVIMEYKESSYLDTWRGSPCNNFSGADGGAFPPGLKTTALQPVFIPDLCRSIYLYYVKSDVQRDVPVYVYTSNLGDIFSNKTWHCFCRNKHPNSCPKKGSMDLNKCMGSPIILTLPHFYLAAPEFLKESIGSKPDPELHKIHLELEPNTGTPLRVAIRFQFNIRIHNISRITIMKTLPKCMHPILWLDQGITVPDEYVNIIKDQLLAALTYIDYGKWGMILVGVAMAVVGGSLHGRQQRAVTPVEQLMSFAPNTPDGKTNPAFEKGGLSKQWNGQEGREGMREGNGNLWINDRAAQEESWRRQDMGYMAMWRDRDQGVEPYIQGGQGNRNANRERREPQVIRNPEVEAWMNREIRGEGLEPRNGNVVRDPEMEAWIRREVGGNRREPRGYQAHRNDVAAWVRETGGNGPADPFKRNPDTEVGIRESEGISPVPPRGSNVEARVKRETGGIGLGMIKDSNIGSRINKEIGDVGRGLRDTNVGSWMTRESGGIGRGSVRDSVGPWMNQESGIGRGSFRESNNVGSWMNGESGGIGRGSIRDSDVGSWMNREGRARQEPLDARLLADVEDWTNRERQGDRWGPRYQDADADPEMDSWMKREVPGADRPGREGRADQWQGRNWPIRRY